MSGLKVNLEKSALLGINCTKADLEGLATKIGCRREEWPIIYLGVTLGEIMGKRNFGKMSCLRCQRS